jgi:hypothetical protein
VALTLEAENRLRDVKLIAEVFDKKRPVWLEVSRESYAFVKSTFPKRATIRPDDVAKVLKPLLEVNDALTTFLKAKRLKQAYWIDDFGDLILDRTWGEIVK